MQIRSAISILVLLAFLPVAVGCSAQRTSYIRDDPVTDETTARLAAGQEVWVSGYTTRTGGFQRWRGEVVAAGPDSLEFQPSNRESNTWREPGAQPFRLARADVVSLEVETVDGGKTVALVALAVGALAIVMVVALAHGIAEGFESAGSPRSTGNVDWDWGW
jgi:hypothetical protein